MSIPPEIRVAEFLRQWPMGSHKSNLIYGVHFDPKSDEVELLASDLRALLDALKDSRADLRQAGKDITAAWREGYDEAIAVARDDTRHY